MPEAPTLKVPNFFIAGFPKAGTTSLYRYLAQHPQVYTSPIKEPTFFAATDLLTREDFRLRQERERPLLRSYLSGPKTLPAPLYVTEWNDYIELFRNAGDELARGEASTGYCWLPSAAGAIHARVPDARLIFVLRDPAERLFSWYLLSLSQHPFRTFRAWFADETRPPEGWHSTLEAGRYATHLQRFHRMFPASQIRTYLSEDVRRDPRLVLRDIFSFLGVDPDVPIDTSARHNETLVPRFPLLHRARVALFGQRSPTGWLPQGVRHALRHVYHQGRAAFALQPDDRSMVIEYYRDEIVRTADLIGRDLSAWLH